MIINKNYAKNRFNVFIILLLLLTFQVSFSQIGEVISSFNSPADSPAGLAWDGQFLWNADANTNRIYKIDPENGNILYSIPGPAGAVINGLTWDGTFLWCCDRENNRLCKINVIDSSIVRIIDIQTETGRGLTFDGTYLWYQDSGEKSIFKIDMATGSYIDTLKSPGGYNRGLAWDGQYLWSCDRDKNEFYQIDSGRGKIISIISGPGEYTYGLTYDGEFLWNTDYNNKKIYKISVHGTEKYQISDPMQAKIRYSATIKNSGSETMDLKTYMACPKNHVYQILDDSLIFHEPTNSFFTDIYGQKIAYYQEFLSPGEQKIYQWTIPTTLFNIRFHLHPDCVGSLSDIPDPIKKLYTRDGDKYKINYSVIRAAAIEAINGETNLYWQVRNIHDYVINHLEYVNDNDWADAPHVLAQGHGSCSEYSFLFIALCRSAGIPARFEAGGHLRNPIPYEDSIFHRWQQVYFPNFGWVPIDCTWDDRDYPCNQARYFGAVSNTTFTTTIGGGGESGMFWTYNSANSSSGGNRDREKLMEWLPYDTSVDVELVEIPNTTLLNFNYPNPFNNSTCIRFFSKFVTPVKLHIFNQTGQLIFSTNKKLCSEGWNEIFWHGTDDSGKSVSSGPYLYRINADNFQINGRMILLK